MYMVIAFGVSCDGGYIAADNGDYVKRTRIGNYAVDSFIGIRKPAYKN